MAMDASSVLSDDDYDIISNNGLDSSLADLNLVSRAPAEPQPSVEAKAKWMTANMEADDVQKWTSMMMGATSHPLPLSTKRVYVDGVFDVFNVGAALQLRQAKLAFPYVHLIVGVFDDAECKANGAAPTYPHVERCEVVRHCRWVDEVAADAPWRIDEPFLSRRRIDYVAFDEGATVDPKYDTNRIKGYDEVKRLGKVVFTRRTTGLTVPQIPALQNLRFSSATPTPASLTDDEDDHPQTHKKSPPHQLCLMDDDDDDLAPPADLFL